MKKTKNSAIGYSGKVTVKILHGNKVVKTYRNHNTGTYRLFEFIARCLGNTYNEMYAPRFVRAFNIEGEFTEEEIINHLDDVISGPIAYNKIDVTTNVDSENSLNDSSTVIFSFLIPASLIFDNQTRMNALALYSLTTYDDESIASPMAYVKLDTNIQINEGSNILIEWSLAITNAKNDEE